MPRSPTLPLWPLYLMFGLMPLWWALGGLYLFWLGMVALGWIGGPGMAAVDGPVNRPAPVTRRRRPNGF